MSARYTGDPQVVLLGQQLASGLWDDPSGSDAEDVRCVRATARALLTLLRAGVTTQHPLHGTQIKKAVEALLALAPRLVVEHIQAAELAAGVAWLVTSGQRRRREIEATVAGIRPLGALAAHLGNTPAVLAYVEPLAR
jgi:Ca-activated chloride channel family protein